MLIRANCCSRGALARSASEDRHRARVHFRFNAWGAKFATWAPDGAAGALLARVGGPSYEAPFVLGRGSIAVAGRERC